MDPYELAAVDARRLIDQGGLSSSELVQSCLDRIDQVNPTVNAMITVAAEQALAAASATDARLAAGPSTASSGELPLLGLPVAIKDLQPTAGIRTTLGSPQFAEHVPEADSGIVARIRRAGGIVIGKTNIPERSIGANTVNPLFGATGNPFDPELSCGGSSGGSAVALASGMAPLATGSDHGGSIRIPAAFCGVVGHRATPGTVPFDERAMTQTFYSVQGPMARTVDDLVLLLSVVSARPSADPMSFPLDHRLLAQLDDVDVTSLRVGVSEDLGGVVVSEPIRRAFRRRVDWLSDRGVECVAAEVDLTDAVEVDWRVRSDIFATYYAAEAETWGSDFNPHIQATYQAALATPVIEIARARRRQVELQRSVAALFTDPLDGGAGVDLLICPTVSVSPFPWADDYPKSIDGQPVENYMAWLALTSAFSVVGHPATALPAGLDEFDMPFGLQLIGPLFGDRRQLSMARSLEQAMDSTEFTRPVPSLAI